MQKLQEQKEAQLRAQRQVGVIRRRRRAQQAKKAQDINVNVPLNDFYEKIKNELIQTVNTEEDFFGKELLINNAKKMEELNQKYTNINKHRYSLIEKNIEQIKKLKKI